MEGRHTLLQTSTNLTHGAGREIVKGDIHVEYGNACYVPEAEKKGGGGVRAGENKREGKGQKKGGKMGVGREYSDLGGI